MADVQHLCDIGRIDRFIVEQPSLGVIRIIVMDDENQVVDIREFPDTAPISIMTGVSRDTSGPQVLCTWAYIRGRASRVNALVKKAIDAAPTQEDTP